MGTFQLGRVGLENTTGEVHGWSSGGSGVRVSGHTKWGDGSDAVAEALVVREQMLGYVEQADEDFVPVVWSEQPEINGFYRVTGLSVDSSPKGAPYGVLDWSVDLVRVQGFAAPLVELTQLGLMRSDTTGWGSRSNGFGLPASAESALEVYRVTGLPQRNGVAELFTRPGESGDVVACEARSDSSMIAYYIDPARFYDAAATLRMGDPLRVVVGRQPQNVVGSWVLGNGLLEVRPFFEAGFALQFRMWLGSEWSVWESITFKKLLPTSTLPAPHTITVSRNSPEAVTVRLLSSFGWVPFTVDLTLRRGARYVQTVYSQAGGLGTMVSLSNFSSPGDVDPAGWDKTVSGVTKFVASNVPTSSPPNFGPVSIPVPDWQFCFGMTDGVTYGARTDDSARSVDEWFWAASEKQSVVAQ